MAGDEMKDSIILYANKLEPLEDLTLEERGIILTAIMAYMTGKEVPEMDRTVRMAWRYIDAQLKLDSEKYKETICAARSEAGKKGAAARWKNGKTMANVWQTDGKMAKMAVHVHDHDHVPEPVHEDESAPAAQAWAPPSIQQVQTFIIENGLKHVRAAEFVEFYAARKWMAGKSRIEWQQKLLEWETNAKSTTTSAELARRKEAERKKNAFHNFDERTDDLEAEFFARQKAQYDRWKEENPDA